jgi:hypothetical protein
MPEGRRHVSGLPGLQRAVRIALLVALAGCGRLGFDPVTGDALLGGTGDGPNGDGVVTDTGSMIDSFPQACLDAIPIGIGRTVTMDTCAQPDRIDGCGLPGAKEIIFRFDPPATSGYTFRAFDGATNNTSNSTAIINAACTGIGSCAGVLGMGATMGQPVYIIVEASNGGCAQIQYSID